MKHKYYEIKQAITEVDNKINKQYKDNIFQFLNKKLKLKSSSMNCYRAEMLEWRF